MHELQPFDFWQRSPTHPLEKRRALLTLQRGPFHTLSLIYTIRQKIHNFEGWYSMKELFYEMTSLRLGVENFSLLSLKNFFGVYKQQK
jgi:hypothetical protein